MFDFKNFKLNSFFYKKINFINKVILSIDCGSFLLSLILTWCSMIKLRKGLPKIALKRN